MVTLPTEPVLDRAAGDHDGSQAIAPAVVREEDDAGGQGIQPACKAFSSGAVDEADRVLVDPSGLK